MQTIELLSQIGELHMALGNNQRALDEFQKALQIDPKHNLLFDGNVNALSEAISGDKRFKLENGVEVVVPEGSYYGAEGGIFVEEIVMNGPAYNAGFKLGDKLISMDGVEIKETGDIIKVRDSHTVGDTIEVIVERDGKEMTLSLTIADSADFPD